MFLLGLKFSQYRNAVSHLHGRTARRMWAHLWPGCPVDEVPISHVTNGIHVSSFIAPELSTLFERHLGPEWYMSSRKPENIQRIDDIYDEELWQAHEMCRTRLVRTCRDMVRRQYERRNASRSVMAEIETVLNPEILTIAFARRFATYKRAALLLQDPQRLKAMVQSANRPVQFVFAGKAHPNDNEGKELIKQVVQFARQADLRQRFVFIENYDMALARCLVQGADIWLNTPRRPNEACGTSGMKAGINGVLNVSILDGWWCEGYNENCGWSIGGGETYVDFSYQDATESQALYNALENQVIPCFYEKRTGEIPRRWVKMMKASMKMIMKNFCSLHMLGEYEKRFYLPIIDRLNDLLTDSAAEAIRLARQEKRLYDLWPQVRIASPQQSSKGPFRVGEHFVVTVDVHLGELLPEEVDVQLYNGHMRSVDDLQGINSIPMTVAQPLGVGGYLFTCRVPCSVSGRYGFSVRVKARGDAHLSSLPGLIAWY
jgi:starch phosphorylase